MRWAAPIFLRRRLLYSTLLHGADFIVRNVFVERAEDNSGVRWFRESSLRDEPGNPNLKEFARVCESLCWDVLRSDYSARLPSLHLPVLALWGDQDKLTDHSGVLRHLGAVPRVRTVLLKRCGHMPMIEQPEDTVFHLQRFLQNPP
jgi:pimeloyl-ACP methyl ester carboxylesterase